MKRVCALLLAAVLSLTAPFVTSPFAPRSALADEAPVFTTEVCLRRGDPPTTFRVYATALGDEFEPVYRLEATAADGATLPEPLLFVCLETNGLSPMLRFIDLNADGWLDIEALNVQGASNQFCSYFIHAGETAVSDGFVRAEALDVLSAYEVYPRQRLILSYGHDSAATGAYSLLRWSEDGTRAALFREASIQWAEGGDWETLRVLVREFGADGAETVLMDATYPVFQSGEEYNARHAEWMAALFTGLDATEPPLARSLYLAPDSDVYHVDPACAALAEGAHGAVDSTGALALIDRCQLNEAAFAAYVPCAVCCAGETR